MKKSKYTLKDIAQRAGCSVSSVSTVLNNSRGNTQVSEDLRTQILEIANSLSYSPNFASRSLKFQSTRTLGIYVQQSAWNQLGNPYEMQIFAGIENAARENDYDLLLLNFNRSISPEICLDRWSQKKIDGVMLLHVQPGNPVVDELLSASASMVAVDYNVDDNRLDTVRFDNAAAVAMAVNHLRERGHRRIGFIGCCLPRPMCNSAIRLEAFGKYHMDSNTLLFSREQCACGLEESDHYCQAEGEMGARYFWEMGEDRPSAIIGYNDLTTISALHYFQQKGIAVPDQISLISIDNSERCHYTFPELTSIKIPLMDMGYHGCQRLIDKISSKGAKHEKLMPFKPELVCRSSVADFTKS